MSEDKIQDAEAGEITSQINREETSAEIEKRVRRDYYIELALFLALGILLGIAVKTEASKHITIGFSDYQMKSGAGHYSINKLQSDQAKKVSENPDGQNTGQNSVPVGASCKTNQY